MKLRTKAAAYGAGALVLASAVILSGTALGLLSPTSTGFLSVLLTDPPTVPQGVTGVYITYANLQVHAVGFGDSGWVKVSGGGTINTMKLVNLSQVISTGSIPSLTYNLVSFNITKATVDFNGKNYTATVSSGKLVVPIVGGLKVNSSIPAAALVDIHPNVINIGAQSAPQFVIATGARALQVPEHEVQSDRTFTSVGSNHSLEGKSWYHTFNQNYTSEGGLTLSTLSLTANSFSLTATNKGSDSTSIRLIILTPSNSNATSGESEGTGNISNANSVMFVVQSDGTLKIVNGTPGMVGSLFEGSGGYMLAGSSSHTFAFSGQLVSLIGNHTVAAGTHYNVIIVGPEDIGTLSVVAG